MTGYILRVYEKRKHAWEEWCEAWRNPKRLIHLSVVCMLLIKNDYFVQTYGDTVSRGYFLFFSFEYLFHENLRRINTTMQFMHPNKCTKNGAERKFDQKVHFLMKRANYVSRTPEDVLNDIWLCCINNVCLQSPQPQKSFSLSRIDFIRPGYNSIYHSSLLVYAIACGKVKWKT